ncbi:hypothetical protein [uncultured Microbacterium sp.]|uniref:hypothetical protein n=1 Tax=uncultured Microbacterium sp. TaxID=191216 RepID=UPI0025DC1E74|nr:hypothetical protein [uncultured Microbacterium sp.]
MAERIAVDSELIGSHASRLGAVASDISLARDAGSAGGLNAEAFGVLCAFLVPPATMAADAAGSLIAAAGEMVRRSATEIVGVGGDMDAYEQKVLEWVRALEAGL